MALDKDTHNARRLRPIVLTRSPQAPLKSEAVLPAYAPERPPYLAPQFTQRGSVSPRVQSQPCLEPQPHHSRILSTDTCTATSHMTKTSCSDLMSRNVAGALTSAAFAISWYRAVDLQKRNRPMCGLAYLFHVLLIPSASTLSLCFSSIGLVLALGCKCTLI